MNKKIELIAKREFGSNEFMVGFQRGIMDKIAGTTKAGNWKQHFDKFRMKIKR